MKRYLTLIVFLMCAISVQLNAQCNFTTTATGNVLTFHYNRTLSPFFTIDSVRLTFGDGYATTQYNTPPSSIYIFDLPHTFPTSGNYNVCLDEYTSWGAGAPQPPCTHCEVITVGSSSSCFAMAGFTSSTNNLMANFSNNSSCASCVTSSYSWDFGDGSPVIVAPAPNHIYAASGTYMVCLVMSGTNSASITCQDTFCNIVTVTAPVSCTAASG
jgi:PKD repeat protein